MPLWTSSVVFCRYHCCCCVYVTRFVSLTAYLVESGDSFTVLWKSKSNPEEPSYFFEMNSNRGCVIAVSHQIQLLCSHPNALRCLKTPDMRMLSLLTLRLKSICTCVTQTRLSVPPATDGRCQGHAVWGFRGSGLKGIIKPYDNFYCA